MRIIVAIDILGGKCVRLTQGDYSTEKIYNENPVEAAKQFADYGIEYLHLVDLDGARENKVVNHKVLREIASGTSLKIDFSGGVRSADDLSAAFENGASQVTCGSVAVNEPDTFLRWLSAFGPEKIILGADSNKRKISINGWKQDTDWDIIDFICDYFKKGVKYTICTDIERDGMLRGPSTELYKEILRRADINLIASGGISSFGDIDNLRNAGCEGVIIGKAVYEGRITLKDLNKLC